MNWKFWKKKEKKNTVPVKYSGKNVKQEDFDIFWKEFEATRKMTIINRKYVVDLVKEINILRKELHMPSLKQRKITRIKLEKDRK